MTRLSHRLPLLLTIGLLLVSFGRQQPTIFAAASTVTPAPASAVINSANVANLKQLAVFGRGAENKAIWSPDGKTIAVTSTAGLSLYNFANLSAPPRLFSNETGAFDAAFSPDGKLVATTDFMGAVWVWNVLSGQVQQIGIFGRATPQLGILAISPDDRHVVIGTGEYIQVRDVKDSTVVTTFEQHAKTVTGFSFNSTGTVLASSSQDGTVMLWDMHTGSRLAILGVSGGVAIDSVTFSPDGSLLAFGLDNGVIQLERLAITTEAMPLVQNLQDAGTLVGHPQGIQALGFSADSKHVLSVGNDSSARVWDIATHTQISFLPLLNTNVYAAFSPDAKWVLTTDMDHLVHIWAANNPQAATTLNDFDAQAIFRAAAFSLNDKFLFGDTVEGELWHLTPGAAIGLTVGPSHVNSIAVSPNGQLLAVGGDSALITLWDTATMNLRLVLTGHDKPITSVAFSPDGQQLVSASEDNTVRTWDVTNGANLATLKGHTDIVYSAAFSPDGKLIASGGQDTTTRLWDAASGQVVALLTTPAPIFVLRSSPDGSQLAAIGNDNTLRLWDVAARQPEAKHPTIALHSSATGLAYSPDGRLLAFADSVQGDTNYFTIHIWSPDTDSNSMVGRYSQPVNQLAFSADGRQLAAVDADGTVRLLAISAPPKTATPQPTAANKP